MLADSMGLPLNHDVRWISSPPAPFPDWLQMDNFTVTTLHFYL